jgi:5-methylcytosine-specific restriction endonuclease McrA
MRHVLIVEDPHPRSMAALIALRRTYRDEEVQRWLKFRESILEACEAIYGCLVCHYCGRRDLVREENPLNGRQPANMATIDHVVPLSKGGAKEDSENCVIACQRCNEKKADKLPG